ADEPVRRATEPSVAALESYKIIVWEHLRKWQMGLHEERLLIAEAASLGINNDLAITIARRINSAAEDLARSRQIRTAFGAVLVACVVLVGVVMFFMFPPYHSSVRPEGEETLTENVRPKPPVVVTPPGPPATKPATRPNVTVVAVPPVPTTRPKVVKPNVDPPPPVVIEVPKPEPKSKPKLPPVPTVKPPVLTARRWPFDADQAAIRRAETARKHAIGDKLVLSLGSGQNLTLRLIPPGEFLMGSPPGEKSRQEDEHLHVVSISKPFYIGISEVTQAQWKAVMSNAPWSGRARARNSGTLPASYIERDEAEAFCKWVSLKTGRKVRLPSEAQWEYACRAGSGARYCFGNAREQLADYASYTESNSSDKKFPQYVIRGKKSNAFGLYDMHGNVAEWCRDLYDPDFYKNSPRVDPVNITPHPSGSIGVYRGGSFLASDTCRSAERQSGIVPPRSSPVMHLGFRVIAELTKPSQTGTKPANKSRIAEVYKKWPFDSSEAKRRQIQTAATLGIKPVVTLPLPKKGEKMTFVLIPAGEFVMGSEVTEKSRREDEMSHKVRITKPFYMSTTEVTEGQWSGVIGVGSSLGEKRQSRLPVHKIPWSDAVKFCKVLKKKTDLNFQLPSEAQWEYACRAGASEAFCFGDNESELGSYATYVPSGKNGTKMAEMTQAAQKKANAFGLYDMHGNVYELCRDYYAPRYYKDSPKDDPENKVDKKNHRWGVMRGGSWMSDPGLCRSAARAAFNRGKRSDAGFRVIFPLPNKAKLATPMFKATPAR
ncbi:MAG: formylglycine-generating enzyme family protein, partial [bacterium]|nr:formylglycine-generating enzyme family protein [bacterium]